MIEIMEKCQIDRTIYRRFPYRSAIFFGKGNTLEEALGKLWDEINDFPSGSVGKTIHREVTIDGKYSEELSDLSTDLYDYIDLL